jgi:hypothetical protein
MFHVTNFLALWGAILSTFAVGWNFYRDWSDRPRLRVSATLDRLTQGEDGRIFAVKHNLPIEGATKQVFLVVSVTNVGRRPTLVKSLGGEYKNPVNRKKHFVVIARNLPKMLGEGEYILEFTDELKAAGENVKALCVWDSSGREWRLPARELKKIKEEARTVLGQ